MGKESHRVSGEASVSARDADMSGQSSEQEKDTRDIREDIETARRDVERGKRRAEIRRLAQRAESPRDLKQLERDIARSRRRLDEYVDELDRRRHRLLAVREHPAAAVGVGVAAVALVAGTVVLVKRRAATRRRTQRKSQNLWQALQRMTEHPERVASDSKSTWSRVAVAVAPILVKKLADAAMRKR